MPDYKSISQFAKIKYIGRPKVYDLINAGLIKTEEVAGMKVIDLDKYKDFDCTKRLSKKAKEDPLVKINGTLTELRKKVRNLEKVVLQHNSSGRSAQED